MLTKFSTFTAKCSMFILQQTNSNKREDVTKQGFCKILRRKLRHRGRFFFSTYSIFFMVSGKREWDGGGHVCEAGCLLTSSAFRMGTYLKWALI